MCSQVVRAGERVDWVVCGEGARGVRRVSRGRGVLLSPIIFVCFFLLSAIQAADMTDEEKEP